MEFDKSKVYTALNADESLIGAKGYFAQSIDDLRYFVVENCGKINEVISLDNDFMVQAYDNYNFFYLVEPAQNWYVTENANKFVIVDKERILKWYFDVNDERVLFSGNKKECEQWIEEHSKPKYRPFKDCDELISYFCHKHSISKTDWGMPFIWVKNKNHSEKYLIIAVTENCVVLYTNGQAFDMQELFEHYTFLDGSVCGVEV